MDLKQANVLITGGSEGIGLGLAQRFLASGSNVIVTGRNAQKLEKAALDLPLLKIHINDISRAEERELLAQYIHNNMPQLNIIINNAGIQRRVSLAIDNADWQDRQSEIDTLLSGPIHLNHLLIPLILSHSKEAVIINVTSGGAYIPQIFAPVYSACKAALHSYTMILRHSLAKTNVRVVELIPPAVKTSLAGRDATHGALLDEFCDKIFPLLINAGKKEVGFGATESFLPEISGQKVDDLFQKSSSRFPVKIYEPM